MTDSPPPHPCLPVGDPAGVRLLVVLAEGGRALRRARGRRPAGDAGACVCECVRLCTWAEMQARTHTQTHESFILLTHSLSLSLLIHLLKGEGGVGAGCRADAGTGVLLPPQCAATFLPGYHTHTAHSTHTHTRTRTHIHTRDVHFADISFPSRLIHLVKGEGMQARAASLMLAPALCCNP